jgi:tetratricopeptide (TPR) repeat protein
MHALQQGVGGWAALLGVCATLPICFVAAHALAQDIGVQIVSIRVAGQPRTEPLELIQVVPPRGELRPLRLRVSERLAAGVEIEVPERTVMVLESATGNRIELAAGTRFRVESVSGRGEWYSLLAGRATMIVRNALSFYNVEFERFVARVRGTEFTLALNGRNEAEARVASGTISVIREQPTQIGDGFPVQAMLVSERVDARNRPVARWPREEPAQRYADPSSAVKAYLLELARAENDADYDAIMSGLNNLGLSEIAAGNDAAARVHFERLLKRAEDREDEPWRARALNNLGAAHVRAEHWLEARQALEAALAINRALAPASGARRIAQNEGNLGVVLRRLGDFEAARAATLRSMKLYRDLAGNDDSPGIASNLESLGHLERDRAIELHGQALAMRQRLYGDLPHPETASSYANLGSALCDAGRIDEGLAQLDAALAIRLKRRSTLPDRDLVRVYESLSACWARAASEDRPGAAEQAVLFLRHARQERERRPGESGR